MAVLTLRAELAEVDIVAAMAAGAVARQFHDASGLAMAGDAGNPGVRAGQFETRLPGMVELPELPAVRGVAGRTVPAEAALVQVVAGVAGVAILRRTAEGP